MRWIKSLPWKLRLADDEVFARHGSPADGDLAYLLEDVGKRLEMAPPCLDNIEKLLLFRFIGDKVHR
jgi:hypothetical protein